MTIRYEPAECCSRTCNDELCPYVHGDAWFVIGDDDGKEYGPFYTHVEAQECNRRHAGAND